MDRTEATPQVCVRCDIDLLRRGIERAATNIGLRITDQEADAAFVICRASKAVNGQVPEVVIVLEDVVISIVRHHALDPIVWSAAGRLVNEVLRGQLPTKKVDDK